jgi:transcriptional regulator with AAA-type ATPase domain
MAAEFQPHRKRILDTLLKMRLPGNFRDLEKLARRILVAGLANGRHLFVTEAIIRHELNRLKQDELRDQNPASNSGRDLLTELPTQARCEAFLREVWGSGGAFPLNTALSTWEQRLMLAAMGIAGSGAKAAGLLAINPRTFTNRIRESGKGQQS